MYFYYLDSVIFFTRSNSSLEILQLIIWDGTYQWSMLFCWFSSGFCCDFQLKVIKNYYFLYPMTDIAESSTCILQCLKKWSKFSLNTEGYDGHMIPITLMYCGNLCFHCWLNYDVIDVIDCLWHPDTFTWKISCHKLLLCRLSISMLLCTKYIICGVMGLNIYYFSQTLLKLLSHFSFMKCTRCNMQFSICSRWSCVKYWCHFIVQSVYMVHWKQSMGVLSQCKQIFLNCWICSSWKFI